jgi:membrane protein
VRTPRPGLARFLVYWTVLTLGPLMVLGGLALSSYFISLPMVSHTAEEIGFGGRLLRLAPTAIELLGFTLAYLVLPHRTVKFRHAFAGGVLATVLFELAKFGFALYLTNASYREIYGAVAVLPILLIWIYVSWVVVLLGASIAASLSAFRFQPAAQRLPEGYEMYGLLRVIGRFEEAQLRGQTLHSEELLDQEPCLTDGLLQEFLGDLARMGVVRRAEDGGWMLARDLGRLSLDDLYEGARLRIPVTEAVLPCREDALGQRALAALDELRLPLREHLKRRIGTIYRD